MKVLELTFIPQRDDFAFPMINFPWLSGDVLGLSSHYISFRSWFSLLGFVLAIWISILILQITSKPLTQSYKCHKLRKPLGRSLLHNLNFCPNLVQYRFKNIFQKESLIKSFTVISLQAQDCQMRSEFNLV